MPRLARSANLKTFLRTAVVGAARDPATGAITSITAVRRSAVRQPTVLCRADPSCYGMGGGLDGLRAGGADREAAHS